jgi:hypothetical protein
MSDDTFLPEQSREERHLPASFMPVPPTFVPDTGDHMAFVDELNPGHYGEGAFAANIQQGAIEILPLDGTIDVSLVEAYRTAEWTIMVKHELGMIIGIRPAG